jgi:hypothetical protein
MWLLMQHDIKRYLEANSEHHMNGALKAEVHMYLCDIFLAGFFGCEIDGAKREYYTRFDAIHKATAEFTDFLDIEIGFPSKGPVDYNKLAPLFFDKFFEIANSVLNDTKGVDKMSISELLDIKEVLPGG